MYIKGVLINRASFLGRCGLGIRLGGVAMVSRIVSTGNETPCDGVTE